MEPPAGVAVRHAGWNSPGMGFVRQHMPALAAKDAVGKALHLLQWLRPQIRLGEAALDGPLYAPAMLKLLQERGQQYTMTCGPASLLFSALCLAQGLEARVVGAYCLAGPELRSHTFVEVWSDELQRWFVADPMYGCLWQDARGLPAAALDLQREYERVGPAIESFAYQPTFPKCEGADAWRDTFRREFIAAYFDLLTCSADNSFTDPEFALRPGRFLGKFAGAMVAHPTSAARAKSHPAWQRLEQQHRVVVAHTEDDWLWRPNQIELRVLRRTPDQVQLAVRHNLPFLLRIEWWNANSAPHRHTVSGSTLSLPARAAATYCVQGLNRLGGKTKVFRVEIVRSE